jgi:anaerobic selenocysteine-containing dehydrogenase
MLKINRRNFVKLGIASSALMASGKFAESDALAGSVKLEYGGKDFSPDIGVERKAIPTACWSCVTRCAARGFVEDGRYVKMESHPKSIRTEGKMCSKGQSAPNEVYFPDRILYPMKRVGARGEGKWKRISWDEAINEIISKIKPLRDAGHPEKLMYHYGRMKASSSKLMGGFFKTAYGTKTVGNHTSICEGGKWTAHELVWGGHFDNWDFDNTGFVMNFGSNCLETHTNHIPVAHRLIRAKVDRGVRVVTFDVRLSNTAAKSDEWIPIKPGGDCAVLLAMCNVVLSKGLYKGKGEAFMKFVKATKNHDASLADKIAALKKQFASYTPAWAEKESSVPAATIERLAVEFANAKPAACLVTYRGAIAHYNGNDAERAAFALCALTGHLDDQGSRTKAVGGGVKYPKVPETSRYPKPKGMKINDGHPQKGHPGYAAYPSHHMSHWVFKMMKETGETPDVYWWAYYNPVYVNGEFAENEEIMKTIPYLLCSNIVYDESSKLADLLIPDATYLERWDWEDMVDPNNIGEQYIRQPMIKPLGEARNQADVIIEVAEKMGIPLGVSSMEEFVQKSYDMDPAVSVAGGFAMMKREGVWHDPNKKPTFKRYMNKVSDDAIKADGVVFDEETGVYWNAKKANAKEGANYTDTKNAYKYYVGQKIGNEVYEGFKPDKLNKSGYFELYSLLLERKGETALPMYTKAPEHEAMGPDDLIMTTYKVAVHIHSRSTHRKWLTELYNDNPGWINSKTAAARGISDGDKIRVTSPIGSIVTKARVTEKIIPGVIAISYHMGRSESGRYGSGNKSPGGHDNDPDLKNKWWTEYGVHPNHIIANAPDPLNGQQRWMDTVVKVAKA